jgi:hypothetical protein
MTGWNWLHQQERVARLIFVQLESIALGWEIAIKLEDARIKMLGNRHPNHSGSSVDSFGEALLADFLACQMA